MPVILLISKEGLAPRPLGKRLHSWFGFHLQEDAVFHGWHHSSISWDRVAVLLLQVGKRLRDGSTGTVPEWNIWYSGIGKKQNVCCFSLNLNSD